MTISHAICGSGTQCCYDRALCWPFSGDSKKGHCPTASHRGILNCDGNDICVTVHNGFHGWVPCHGVWHLESKQVLNGKDRRSANRNRSMHCLKFVVWLILSKIVTANKLIDEYNAGLQEAVDKVTLHNASVIQDLSAAGATRGTVRRSLLPVPKPCPHVNKKWCRKFYQLFLWRRKALNTAGNFLEFDDPRLRASRLQLHSRIEHDNVHKWLILNIDQVWRQSLRFEKSVLMKKTNRTLDLEQS